MSKIKVEYRYNDEVRVSYNTEEDGKVYITVSDEGIILDLYEDDEHDPYSLGFTLEELAEFLKERGVR